MSYTVLVKNNNTAISTNKERILQRSKNVHNLEIIIPIMYGDYDTTDWKVLLEYKLPISHNTDFIELDASEYGYKNDYNLYSMTFDTNLTKEPGDIEFELQMIGRIMNPDTGEVVDYVRYISPFKVHIYEITDWFTVPDKELATLTQMYLGAQQQIEAINDILSTIDDNSDVVILENKNPIVIDDDDNDVVVF